jgi:hypothetical protein
LADAALGVYRGEETRQLKTAVLSNYCHHLRECLAAVFSIIHGSIAVVGQHHDMLIITKAPPLVNLVVQNFEKPSHCG